MTTCEQLEQAIRDLIKECKSHPVDADDIELCSNCCYCEFCDRFYPKGDGTWDWVIEDKETK